MADKPSPLSLAMARLSKKWGEGVLMDLDMAPGQHPSISTGHPGIDRITGIGGFPQGKIVELYGMESSGKSTLATHVAANVQKKPINTGRVLYVDWENSFDKYYAERLGMKTDKDHFIVAQPDFAEQGLDIINEFVENELCDMFIADSVAAMLPQSEMVDEDHKGSMGHQIIGSQSRVVSQALKQLASKMNKKRCLGVFINQIRTKIGMGKQRASQTTTGGHALKFYSSMRIELRKVKMVEEKGRFVAMLTRVKISKNKVGSPFGECDAVFRFGQGMDVTTSIFAVLVAQKLLAKNGQGFYDLEKFGVTEHPRGDAMLRDFVNTRPQLWDAMLAKVDWEVAAKATARGNTEESGGDSDEFDGDASLVGDANSEIDALLGTAAA